MDHSKLTKNAFIAKATTELYDGMTTISHEQKALEELVRAQQSVVIGHALKLSQRRKEWWEKAAKLYDLDLAKYRYMYNEATGEIRYDGLLADD